MGVKFSTFMEIDVFERIRKITELRGITTRQLLKGIGLTEQSYYRMVREKSIKLATFDKILSFLRVTPEVFYSDSIIDTVQNTPVDSQKSYGISSSGSVDVKKQMIEKDLKLMESLIKSIRETMNIK